MADRLRQHVGLVTEVLPQQRYPEHMAEKLSRQQEASGDDLDGIEQYVADITGRLPYPPKTPEGWLQTDCTLLGVNYDRTASGMVPYFLRLRFIRRDEMPHDARPLPIIERLDRQRVVTDALVWDKDRVVDQDMRDRGESGKKQMTKWLQAIDVAVRLRSSAVSSNGVWLWRD